jgi:hypothetical protein
MPSVKIRHCLICDAAREEARNKVTLLGFFGIAPDVEIRVDRLDAPINELAFIFLGSISGSAGSVELTFEVFDVSDSLIFSHSQRAELQPKERANIIFDIHLLKFRHPGRHKVRLRSDGDPVHTGEFLIARNEPALQHPLVS